MDKVKPIIVVIILGLSPINPSLAIGPKSSTIILNSVYGAIGGTLLGVASLAFGGKGKYVAKGASLGLYTGLAFGTYVVASHTYGKYRGEDGDGSFQGEDIRRSYFDFGGGGKGKYQERGEYYPPPNRHQHPSNLFNSTPFRPTFYIGLWQYRF